jgi:TolB protein
MNTEIEPHSPRTDRRGIIIAILTGLVLLVSGLAAFLYFNKGQAAPQTELPPTVSATAFDLSTAVPLVEPHIELEATALPTLPVGSSLHDSLSHSGLLILSMADGYNNHLFAYHPQFMPLTRLTSAPFDDITPAVSPDGSRIAFSSRRNGFWDLYLMELPGGDLTKLTDTPAYDGAPTWSPDGKWLAYETYSNGNLDIMLLAVDRPSNDPIRITDDPAADYAPAWSPAGRSLAFISQRSGEPDVWLADLDENIDPFTNLSRTTTAQEDHPEWSPDGRYLVWGAAAEGSHNLYLWDSQNPDSAPGQLGAGFLPAWSPLGESLAAGMIGPNETTLGGYNLRQRALAFPAERLPGGLFGLDWASGDFAANVLAMPLPENAADPAPLLWTPALNADPLPPDGRFGIVKLEDVTVPHPYLVDLADESFNELRKFTALQSGWDFLSSLENAYLPLSEPPTLAAQQNWLFTGRAFAFNPVPLNAGFISLVREQINGQTYWRVYLKTRYQDGSQGMPLTSSIWDINARYNEDPLSYEQGGLPKNAPSGYWVDFTDLAARYNWERLPAQLNWRTFINAARFNQFVLTSGLTWHQAMAEIFPAEALITPTSVPSLTPLPTSTPKDTNWHFYTVTPTFQPTPTPIPRPTWTPLP